MPQDAVYVLNYQFLLDAIFPLPNYLGVKTKWRKELLSPLSLMTHLQKFYSHSYRCGLCWLRGLHFQGGNFLPGDTATGLGLD